MTRPQDQMAVANRMPKAAGVGTHLPRSLPTEREL